MKINTEIQNGIAVIKLNGKLLGGPPASDDIKNQVYSLLDDGVKKIVIDLEKVSRMNSSGLGILIASLTSIKNRDGELLLASVNETMEGVMVMTKLDSIFTIHKTAQDATNAFSS